VSLRGQIIFSSDRRVGNAREFDLWVMNPDGSGQRPLLEIDGDDLFPDLSPDGTRVVWLHYDPKLGSGGCQLWTMDASGANRALLAGNHSACTAPRWSPDGTHIAFADDLAEVAPGLWGSVVYTVRPGGADLKVAAFSKNAAFRHVAWSVDGSRLVADTYADGRASGIYIVDLAESTATRIHTTTASLGGVAWSPADVILFSDDFGIFTIQPDGSDLRKITATSREGGWPEWSSDGQRIIYTLGGWYDTDSEIWSVSADGSDPRNLSHFSGPDKNANF
jgi:TolB protein